MGVGWGRSWDIYIKLDGYSSKNLKSIKPILKNIDIEFFVACSALGGWR